MRKESIFVTEINAKIVNILSKLVKRTLNKNYLNSFSPSKSPLMSYSSKMYLVSEYSYIGSLKQVLT